MEREWIANPNESDTGVHTNSVIHTKLLSWTGDQINLEFRTDKDFNTKTGERTPSGDGRAQSPTRRMAGTCMLVRRNPDPASQEEPTMPTKHWCFRSAAAFSLLVTQVPAARAYIVPPPSGTVEALMDCFDSGKIQLGQP